MEKYLTELEELLLLQDNYLKRLIELGLCLENSGEHDNAFKVYKKGIESVEKVRMAISGTMLGLLD